MSHFNLWLILKGELSRTKSQTCLRPRKFKYLSFPDTSQSRSSRSIFQTSRFLAVIFHSCCRLKKEPGDPPTAELSPHESSAFPFITTVVSSTFRDKDADWTWFCQQPTNQTFLRWGSGRSSGSLPEKETQNVLSLVVFHSFRQKIKTLQS